MSPEKYRSFEQPWQPPLGEHLTKVWSCEENGQVVSVIYKYSPD